MPPVDPDPHWIILRPDHGIYWGRAIALFVLIVVAMLAIAIETGGTAHADTRLISPIEARFLNLIERDGMSPRGTLADAADNGWAICSDLSGGRTEAQQAELIWQHNVGGLSHAQSYNLVFDAVSALCPGYADGTVA